jgi:hypothetical protein
MAMLKKLAGSCSDGVTCPAVYAAGEEDVIVRGYVLGQPEQAELDLPDNETAVRIPRSLLAEVAGKLHD